MGHPGCLLRKRKLVRLLPSEELAPRVLLVLRIDQRALTLHLGWVDESAEGRISPKWLGERVFVELLCGACQLFKGTSTD